MKTLFKILLFSLLINSFLLKAQQNPVTITVAVQPPYSPYFSDYVNQPNKIMVILTSTVNKDVYLHGSITSLGGIDIHNTPGFKQDTPIHLTAGMPYNLTIDEIQNLYDVNDLIFEGIDKETVIQTGQIPEDNYEICIKAYDYDTDVLVSGSTGCSINFMVSNIEPPIITSPQCGTEYTEQNPLVVNINWTMPANVSPSNVYYHFRMVEIPQNSNIDMQTALTDPSYPSFFERDYTVNSIVLTSSEINFMPGNIYAYDVWVGSTNSQLFMNPANDNHQYYFSNNGLSEVCWFKYTTPTDENATAESNSNNFDSSLQDYANQFTLIPETQITGRLFYKLPQGQQTMSGHTPNPNNTNQQQSTYATSGYDYTQMTNMSLNFSGDVNENSNFFNGLTYGQNSTNPNVNLGPPFARGLMNSHTINVAGSQPLANTEVRLVARLVLLDENQNGTIVINPNGTISGRGQLSANSLGSPLTDIGGNEVERGQERNYINIVLDQTTTDAQGNYSFDFRSEFITAACQIVTTNPDSPSATGNNPVNQTVNNQINSVINPANAFQGVASNSALQGQTQGQMHTMSAHLNPNISNLGYICLKVEVVNQKFCAPDVDIFAMPGDQINLGDEVALIKTYNAEISVKSDNSKPQMNGANKPLANSKIKILRREDELDNEHPAVLNEEGQKLNSKIPENNISYKIVAKGITGNDGKVIIKNLVKHWDYSDGGSPYLISIKTRKDSVSNQYENTFYNYENLLKRIQTYYMDEGNGVNTQTVVCNRNYTVPTLALEYSIAPKNPEIKGRIMAKSNMETIPVSNAKIIVLTQDKYEKGIPSWAQTESETQTNQAGFFRFTNLPVNVDKNGVVRGPYRRLWIKVPGYKDTIINPNLQYPYNLNRGQLKDLHDIYLQPDNILKGTVVDEQGNPIEAYVKQLPNGPYFKTHHDNILSSNNFSWFEIPVSLQDSIIIEPLSSQYFNQKYEVKHLPNGRKTYVVYKKLHRLRLLVTDKQNSIIANANVVVGDNLLTGKTDNNGIFKGKFATPDAQFVVKVTADNYAPKQMVITLPVSKDWTDKKIQLEHGFNISGYITDSTTGNKVEGAKIYTELQNTGGHRLYIEAVTNSNGKYTLKGIPENTHQITLHINKEGNNPSYVGKKADVQVGMFLYPKPSYDFSIRSLSGWDLTQLLGFPIQVEEFRGVRNHTDQAYISGYFHHLPTVAGYQTQENDYKADFYSVKVKKTTDGKLTMVDNYAQIDAYKIPVKINQTFTGILQGKTTKNGNVTTNHAIELQKENATQGHITSYLKLDLESFRFAYGFGGNFYLGDNQNTATTTVFKTKIAHQIQNTQRYVFDLNKQGNPIAISNYKLFGFTADAVREHSILTGNKLILPSILHTAIPLKNKTLDLKMPIGNIEITKNDIQVKQTPNQPIQFKLEKWTVDSKKAWTFSKNEEAIVFPELLISSDKGLSVSVKNMRIRYDALREGQVKINNGLTLGGFYPIHVAKGLSPLFNYDSGVGHYRISLIGETNEKYAASITKLPKTDKDLHFTSVAMLSDDSQVLSLHQKMRFYNIVDITVDQIMSGNGYFKLSGNPDLGIPGFVPTDAIITYTQNNLKKPVLEPLQGAVDCNHDVTYVLDAEDNSQHISDGLLTIYGNFKVEPSANEPGGLKDAFTLRGFLTKTNSEAKIEVIKVDNQGKYKGANPQVFPMDNKKLWVLDGQTYVQNDSWEALKFKAKPDAKDQKGMKDENVLNFAVNGNISIDGDGIKMDNVEEKDQDNGDSPFGQWSMGFNFADKTLRGSGEILPMPLGYADIDGGLIKLLIGPKGFYFGAEVDFKYNKIPFNGGLIIGYTDYNLQNETRPLLYKFRAKGKDRPDFTSGLKGFYFIGQVPILDNKEVDLVVLKAYMDAGAGVWLKCNYAAAGGTYMLGGYGYYNIGGGMSVPGVCDFSLCLDSYMTVSGGYRNKKLEYGACNDMIIKLQTCLGDIDKSAYLKINQDGSDGGLGSSGCGGREGVNCK